MKRIFFRPKHKPEKPEPYSKLGKLDGRDPDGHNNDGDNNDANDKGTHDGVFSRITTNSYPDGIGSLPAQAAGLGVGSGSTLPAPRAVSDAIMDAGTTDIPNSFGVNEFFQFFGQALTHDMAEASTGTSGDPPVILSGLPFPFTRTPFEGGTGTSDPREQINDETSFLDLSMVYGNNQTLTDLVRADLPGHAGQSAKILLGPDGLLPTVQQVADDAGITAADVRAAWVPPGFFAVPAAGYEDFFFAGDNRVDQTPQLISQQTIWAREHNYQVDKLAPYAAKYGWSQDQLFEAARAVTEAEWQHVIYEEYLPKLIGKHALDSYQGYKANVDPSIINEFTTVAFRFGHDQSSQNQNPLTENGTSANPGGLFTLFTLAEAFGAGADGARTSDNIDEWLRGQLASYTQEIDGLVVDGNRNTLFNIGNGFVTVDLEVFDIMRARDHGVWNYNDLREGIGLSAYADFDAFGAANNVDPTRLQALKNVYDNNIDLLDSVVGGLLEKKYYDSQLGETFTKIIATQFENLRDGDALFYESRLDPTVLAEVESTSLADILARTTGIDHLYRDAFAAHDRISDNDRSIDGSDRPDLAIATDAGEVIRTYGGDDDIYAGKGNDYLFAGKGNDWLWTGAGRDIVILEQDSGYDTVHDFQTKYDKLDLTDYGIDTWKEVKKAVHKSSDGVVLTLDSHDKVELIGVKVSDLSSKNFIFDHNYDYPVA